MGCPGTSVPQTQPTHADAIRAAFSSYKERPDESVQQAHDKLRSLGWTLNQLEKTDHYNELRISGRLLHALSSEYFTVRYTLESKEIDESNLDDCVTRVLNKEAELNVQADEDAHSGNDRRKYGKGKPRGKGNPRNQDRGGRSGSPAKGKANNNNGKNSTGEEAIGSPRMMPTIET
ncbi:hypothetical protein VTN31DRAFT_2031 [Thermomyces dupontii]|uniref:uncharacterized protein n=1 Tax=Talaromyces thermophilus TaxID=28565 RepID=UPI003743D463